MIKYFDKNAARINLIKFSAIFALVVFSPIDVSAGPSACGNIDNQYYSGEDSTFTCGNGYDVSSEFEFTDPKGRSCTSSPTVDYSIARAKLTSSDADTYRLYLIEKPHEWDGGWADIDFQCSYGGCDSYDRMWSGSGTHDIDINNESDGGIKSQYWMAYFQDSTGNGCARWDGESFNEYSHVNFHPEVSGPSPSNGGNNVGVSPDLQVDVSDAEGDYTDVEFYNANGDSSLGIDNSIPDGGTASETWFDVDEYSTEYSWYVRWDQNDGHTEQSNTYSFTTEANAAFSYGPSFPVGGTLINFDASGTSNGDGISSYEWDWDDDGTYEASGISASHSYSSKGDQTVTLKVTDTYGQTDTVTKTVSVGEQTNNDATQGSIWIEDETLHWVNGNTEYWIRGDPNKIAEAGLASDLLDATSSAVSFQSSFSETPYVFATTQTTSGSQNPSQAHTWSVDKSGFTTQHCEYEAPDGCDTHSAETNGWSAINPSKIRDIAGMDAGTVSIQDSNTVSVSYNKNFDNTPIIFTQVQTKNGNDNSRTSRVGNRDTNGFDIRFCEQESKDGCDSHPSETISWWAIDPIVADKGDAFDWGTTTQEDSNWNSISFSQSYSSTPVMIGTLQTLSGEDAHYIEANNVGTSGGDIRFCESDGADDCDTHGSRELGWLSMSQNIVERDSGASTSGPTGSAWIEGDSLHWIDETGVERSHAGTDTAQNPSSGSPGNFWIDTGLNYIDASGNERKTGEIPTGSTQEIYGDGIDGSITRTSSGTESGVLYTTDYTIESGVTRTVSGTTIIHAQNKITIDGTLDATGAGASGGPAGTQMNGVNGEDGFNGAAGLYVSNGGSGGQKDTGTDSDGAPGSIYGGAGAAGWGACNGGEYGGSGGNGGGATSSVPAETDTTSVSGDTALNQRTGWSELYDLPSNVAAGGGGGAKGGDSEGGTNGKDGGAGGAGAGMIILVAPEIEINGQVLAEGEDGEDGVGAEDGSTCGTGGGGGSGGGGAGGLIYLVNENLYESGTVSVAGGAGGLTPQNSGWAHNGGDGANGRAGEVYRIDVGVSPLFSNADSWEVVGGEPVIDESQGTIENLQSSNTGNDNRVLFTYSDSTNTFRLEYEQTSAPPSQGTLDRYHSIADIRRDDGNTLFDVNVVGNNDIHVYDPVGTVQDFNDKRDKTYNTGISASGTHVIEWSWDGSAWNLDIDDGAYTRTMDGMNEPLDQIDLGSQGTSDTYLGGTHTFNIED